MKFAFPETAQLIGRTVTGQDSDGNDVYGPVETDVKGAYAPAGSIEKVQGQDVVIANPRFYLNDGEPTPAATDRLRVRGVVHEITGRPQVYQSPLTGYQPGAVVEMTVVT